MVQENQPFTAHLAPPALAALPLRYDPAGDAAASEPETPEQEIARLTWTVLDGGASLTQRQRLADLINSQHARRARRDAS